MATTCKEETEERVGIESAEGPTPEPERPPLIWRVGLAIGIGVALLGVWLVLVVLVVLVVIVAGVVAGIEIEIVMTQTSGGLAFVPTLGFVGNGTVGLVLVGPGVLVLVLVLVGGIVAAHAARQASVRPGIVLVWLDHVAHVVAVAAVAVAVVVVALTVVEYIETKR